MKYMLLAYGNEEKCNQMSKDELAEIGEKCKGFDAEIQAAGRSRKPKRLWAAW